MVSMENRQAKLPLLSRSALVRLAILLGLGSLFVVWAWWTMMRMPLKSYAGPWVALSQEEVQVRDRLRTEVEVLARTIGERNVFVPHKLKAAADHIRAGLVQAGYEVHEQTFDASGQTCVNLEAQIPGREKKEEILVVGAHYDSVIGCPGANDNASAVAALLVLAGSLSNYQPARTVRFVAFPNEEPPFFQTEQMGSLVYARRCQTQGERVVAMLSLETIGYYSEEKGSQRYPFPVGLFYPSTGNFIGFVGNTGSAQCVAIFRQLVQVPSEGGALPGWLPGIGWSDHWSFWQVGYPAVMVTDTAPFRYPYYHTAEDTPDKLDYDRLARVVVGLEKVVRQLARP
jgi:hypothetical protein